MNERQAEIILWYSDQLRAGPLEDANLLKRAQDAGFTEDEVRDAIQAAQDQGFLCDRVLALRKEKLCLLT